MRSKKYIVLMFLLLGTMLLGACSPGDLQIPETGATPGIDDAGDLPAAAVLTAQQWLADQLGVTVGEVQIEQTEQVDWEDSCLGLGLPEESCAQAVTPGWRITFVANGQTYEVRTDQIASTIRMAQ